MIPNIWENMFQTTNQIDILRICHWNELLSCFSKLDFLSGSPTNRCSSTRGITYSNGKYIVDIILSGGQESRAMGSAMPSPWIRCSYRKSIYMEVHNSCFDVMWMQWDKNIVRWCSLFIPGSSETPAFYKELLPFIIYISHISTAQQHHLHWTYINWVSEDDVIPLLQDIKWPTPGWLCIQIKNP